MFKLKELFNLPGKIEPASNHIMGEKWFPDVGDLQYSIDYEKLQEIDADARLLFKELAYEQYEGSRFAALYTIWFDNKPFMYIQEAGRSGRDHFVRGIVDAATYQDATNYLRSKIATLVPDDEVYDLEMLVYPEQVFHFYGQDFGTALGYPSEAIATGFMLLHCKSVLPIPDADKLYLITAKADVAAMPEYVRRSEVVLRRIREMTEEEHDLAPNVRLHGRTQREVHYSLYEIVERPEGAGIISI